MQKFLHCMVIRYASEMMCSLAHFITSRSPDPTAMHSWRVKALCIDVSGAFRTHQRTSWASQRIIFNLRGLSVSGLSKNYGWTKSIKKTDSKTPVSVLVSGKQKSKVPIESEVMSYAFSASLVWSFPEQ